LPYSCSTPRYEPASSGLTLHQLLVEPELKF
jgi:hypothetical protein